MFLNRKFPGFKNDNNPIINSPYSATDENTPISPGEAELLITENEFFLITEDGEFLETED